MTECQIELSGETWAFKATGPESFVKEMVSEYAKPWLDHSAPSGSPPASPKISEPQNSVQDASVNGITAVAAYENVFDFADEQLKIITEVGGSNNAEKTRRTALTYLFGQSLLGETTVQSEQIRAACSDQGCYDSNNFAQYLKSLKNKVVMNTKAGGGYAVKLTAPGRADAKKLAEELNGTSDG